MKSEVISLRIAPELLQLIDKAAASEERKRNDYLTRIITLAVSAPVSSFTELKTRGEIENTTPEPIAPMSAKRTSRRSNNGN
jgi:hypothetical protein